jgi:hypothetical protein
MNLFVSMKKLKHQSIHHSVRKSIRPYFWGNLVDFNEARLHEPSYACVNFSRLSIASVDGEQDLSEVVFSALVGF